MAEGMDQQCVKAWERSAPPLIRKSKIKDEGIPLEDREQQQALDLIEEASMESFPASDPPSFTTCHI